MANTSNNLNLTSGLKYLIISYVDKLFLKQKIQFHISNDLVAYSFYSFKTF